MYVVMGWGTVVRGMSSIQVILLYKGMGTSVWGFIQVIKSFKGMGMIV